MADLTKLKQRILEDAESMEREILEAARADAETIAENAARQNAEAEAGIMNKARGDAEAAASRIKSAHEADRRKAELKLKQDLIDGVYAEALRRVISMPQAEYFGLIESMIGRLIKSGSEEILLGGKDFARMPQGFEAELRRKFGQGIALRDGGAGLPEGFIIRNGDVEINCTFEAIIGMGRAGTEAEVNRILFG